MKKKEVLRKVRRVFAWLYLFYMTVEFLLGKTGLVTTVCMFILYSILALLLLLIIIFKIINEALSYIAYKQYEKSFKYLEAVHKARYKLYFTGTSKDVETYSAEIERYGNDMVDVGEYYIASNILSKTQTKRVQEILDQTKKMMTSVN